MSGATWETDPKFIRQKHAWKLNHVRPQEWGATVVFVCANAGCPTSVSVPVRPGETLSGICLDRDAAKQLTDREGNPV